MKMFINPLKIIVISMALYQGQALASSTSFNRCIDPEGRFLIQEFIPSGHGDLGNMRFIDMFNRQVIDLFCGQDKDLTHRTEFACVSSHLESNGSDKTIRVRVHRQSITTLPRLALLEIQLKDQPVGSINEIIPMPCE